MNDTILGFLAVRYTMRQISGIQDDGTPVKGAGSLDAQEPVISKRRSEP
jgi:hypothetical protein